MKKNVVVIIAIALVVVLLIILYKERYNIKRMFVNGSSDNSVNGLVNSNYRLNLPTNRKAELEMLASQLYKDLYNTSFWRGHNMDLYVKALLLSNADLLYLKDYYKEKVSGGIALQEDIEEDYFPLTTVDEELKARLINIDKLAIYN